MNFDKNDDGWIWLKGSFDVKCEINNNSLYLHACWHISMLEFQKKLILIVKSIVAPYNYVMGGVDLGDMLMKLCKVNRNARPT